MSSTPPFVPARPPTPQAMLHRLPDKPEEGGEDAARQPSRHIVLITGSTAVAGKVQIATSVSRALGCPLYQGDSLHESSAKAAGLGATAAAGEGEGGPNETRYRRMWLSKMTRTGLLFPEESRPANQGFSGFGGGGGGASASTSRRGSASSVASALSSSGSDASSFFGAPAAGPASATARYVNAPPAPVTREGLRLPGADNPSTPNPALMVLTHPELERWHKVCIKKAVGEYGVGVLFVPLHDDDDFPRLRPLDPRTMTSFGPSSLAASAFPPAAEDRGVLRSDDVVRVDVDADVEGIIEEVVQGVRDALGV